LSSTRLVAGYLSFRTTHQSHLQDQSVQEVQEDHATQQPRRVKPRSFHCLTQDSPPNSGTSVHNLFLPHPFQFISH